MLFSVLNALFYFIEKDRRSLALSALHVVDDIHELVAIPWLNEVDFLTLAFLDEETQPFLCFVTPLDISGIAQIEDLLVFVQVDEVQAVVLSNLVHDLPRTVFGERDLEEEHIL